jgi:hypothetical protein
MRLAIAHITGDKMKRPATANTRSNARLSNGLLLIKDSEWRDNCAARHVSLLQRMLADRIDRFEDPVSKAVGQELGDAIGLAHGYARMAGKRDDLLRNSLRRWAASLSLGYGIPLWPRQRVHGL